jgi:hypothetical protein
MKKPNGPESVVREIKRKTRRKYSSEEKIRIVLEGLRGEESIAELCRREGINPNLYYNWSIDGGHAIRAKTAAFRRSVATLIVCVYSFIVFFVKFEFFFLIDSPFSSIR